VRENLTKLTQHDHDLIMLLAEEKRKHIEKGRMYRDLMHKEFVLAGRLTYKIIAEKFGVSENYLCRLFAAEKEWEEI
jgi:AraC-like DNA-binding protein